MKNSWHTSRRAVLGGLAALPFAGSFPTALAAPITRAIPSSGEAVPVIGMGSWITFNVGEDRRLRDARAEVLRTFFDRGGRSEEHTSELQSLMRISYAVFCLNKKNNNKNTR